jgi:hypothetical protein
MMVCALLIMLACALGRSTASLIEYLNDASETEQTLERAAIPPTSTFQRRYVHYPPTREFRCKLTYNAREGLAPEYRPKHGGTSMREMQLQVGPLSLLRTDSSSRSRFLATNLKTASAADAQARPALLAALANRATRAYLRTVPGIDTGLPELPADVLLERLERELAASEVLHTFPASVAAALARGECGEIGCAGTDLAVERSANTTWLHNEWELPLLGARCIPPPWHNGSATTLTAHDQRARRVDEDMAAEQCGTESWLWGCDLAEQTTFCAKPNHSLCFPMFSSRRAGVNHQNGPMAWPANLREAADRPVYHSSNFHRQPVR